MPHLLKVRNVVLNQFGWDNIVFYNDGVKKHHETSKIKFISYLLVQMYKMSNALNCYDVDMKNNWKK